MISNSPHASFPHDDDRFFSAVRYLLAEMSTEEAERFEAELDDNQELRELVAEAMLVLEAACAVEPVDTPSLSEPATTVPAWHKSSSEEQSFRWTSLPWAALAAGLLLAVALGLGVTFWPGQEPTAKHSMISPADETQLAVAWARRVAAQEDELTTLWDEGLLTAAVADEPAPEDTFDRLLAGSADAPPAWMIQALSVQQKEDSARPSL